MLWQCADCGHELPDRAAACPACGHRPDATSTEPPGRPAYATGPGWAPPKPEDWSASETHRSGAPPPHPHALGRFEEFYKPDEYPPIDFLGWVLQPLHLRLGMYVTIGCLLLLLQIIAQLWIERRQREHAAATAVPTQVAQPPATLDTTARDSAAKHTAMVSTYFDFEVDKQAVPYPTNPTPLYPPALASAGVGGDVISQFVIDTTGYVEMNTFKVVRSDNDLFTASVKAILPTCRFYPAMRHGRSVRELVEVPYSFRMK
jgi:protein TonB